MQIIVFVCGLAAVSIVYLILGIALTLASVAIWEAEWVTTPRRILAAAFFPLAYFLDGKTGRALAYPVFGKHAKAAYMIVSVLTWPRVVVTTGLAVYLGFCRAYITGCSPSASSDTDDD